MEFALALRELLHRKIPLGLGVLIAATLAIFAVAKPVNVFHLQSRSLVYSAASTQLFVDSSSSVLGNVDGNVTNLQALAGTYANFMASPTILRMIGSQVGLSGGQLYATGPLDPNVPRTVQEPTELQRNIELTGQTSPYQLGFTVSPTEPQVGIYAQAPTTALAISLANASAVAITRYVDSLETTDRVPESERVTIRQLGTATGAVVDGGIKKELAALVFVAVLIGWCVLLLAGSKVWRIWQASGEILSGASNSDTEEKGSADCDAPAPASADSDTRTDENLDEFDRVFEEADFSRRQPAAVEAK
jgi:hypothetical protein